MRTIVSYRLCAKLTNDAKACSQREECKLQCILDSFPDLVCSRAVLPGTNDPISVEYGKNTYDILYKYEYSPLSMNSDPPVSKSTFGACLAGIERVLPHLKGELIASRAVLSSWSVAFTPRHALPMEPHWAALLGLSAAIALL